MTESESESSTFWQEAKDYQSKRQTYRRRSRIGSAREAIVNRVEPASRVLDLGCGDGSLLAALRDERECEVRGIDIAPGAISIAQSRGIDAICGDIDTFDENEQIGSIIDASYDVVTFSKSIQYISRRDEVLARLNTRRIFVFLGNRDRLRLINQNTRPTVLPATVDSFIRWVESFGYKGQIIYFDRRISARFNLDSLPLPKFLLRRLAMNLAIEFVKVQGPRESDATLSGTGLAASHPRTEQ